MKGSLEIFYVVTTTSMFEVRAGGLCNALVTEIAHEGRLVTPGRVVATGKPIVVARTLRDWDRTRGCGGDWGGFESSPVVALFATDREGAACLEASFRQPLDQRWQQETNEMLERIGSYHPCAIVSEVPEVTIRRDQAA